MPISVPVRQYDSPRDKDADATHLTSGLHQHHCTIAMAASCACHYSLMSAIIATVLLQGQISSQCLMSK